MDYDTRVTVKACLPLVLDKLVNKPNCYVKNFSQYLIKIYNTCTMDKTKSMLEC